NQVMNVIVEGRCRHLGRPPARFETRIYVPRSFGGKVCISGHRGPGGPEEIVERRRTKTIAGANTRRDAGHESPGQGGTSGDLGAKPFEGIQTHRSGCSPLAGMHIEKTGSSPSSSSV